MLRFEVGNELYSRNLIRKCLFFLFPIGHEKVVKTLIEHGAIVDSKGAFGRTPLYLAITYGNFSDNWRLITVNWKKKNSTQLQLFLIEIVGKIQLLKVVNDLKPEIITGITLIVSGYEKVVKRLLEKTSNVNTETDDEDTPLCFAASGGNFRNVGHLYRHRHMNVKMCFKWKKIINYSGYYDIVKLLIKKGANVNFRDNEGITPLYQASLYGIFLFFYIHTHYNTIKLFIKWTGIETAQKI